MKIDARIDAVARRAVSTLLLLVGLGFTACSPKSAPVPESQYRTALVGDWLGTVGEMKESITYRADGSFTAQVRPTGFISNTLGQGVTGDIHGQWTLQGRVLTLNSTGAENETVVNKTTTSTIESFQQNAMVVKSGQGETSTFTRARSL